LSVTTPWLLVCTNEARRLFDLLGLDFTMHGRDHIPVLSTRGLAFPALCGYGIVLI
jgi:hypothetical protein